MIFGVIIMPFNAIIWIVLVLLAVIGLSAVIRGISHAFFCSGMPQCCCTVVMLCGNDADAALRSAIEQTQYERIYDKVGKCRKITAVDMGLDPNVRAICNVICDDCGIEMCDEQTLIEHLKNLTDCN